MATVFNKNQVNHLEQPIFFGEETNVARFETQKHETFEKLIEKQLSFFWRPEEVDVTRDKIDYDGLPEHEKHIFTSNLKYQSLLDSVQGRAPGLAFLPIVSDVTFETWVETWSFSETIHSRSYTHIMRNVYEDPSRIFDEIVLDPAIMKRAESVSKYYDDLINATTDYHHFLNNFTTDTEVNRNYKKLMLRDIKKKLYLCMHAVNALEAIRFYVSFACTFAFAEDKKMEGSAKIMKLIARDEQLHLKGTQYVLRLFQNGKDDPEMVEIAKECEAEAVAMFLEIAEQEKEWVHHLFQYGSMTTLNHKNLCAYVDYLTRSRMISAGLPTDLPPMRHPLPWIRKWLNSDSVQVAAQEAELSSYLIAQIDPKVSPEFLSNMKSAYPIL